MALPSSAALIEVLHQRQQQHRWLAPHVLAGVARELALPLSRVQGVASFYHLFALRPPPAHRCGVCLGTACFVRGGERLWALLEAHLAGSDWSLEPLGCVGACGLGPVLQLDGRVAGPAPLDDPHALEGWWMTAGAG